MDGLLITKEIEQEITGEVETETTELEALIDKMGSNQQAVDLAKKIIKEHEADQKRLRELLDAAYAPDTGASTERGKHWTLIFGAKAQQRTITDMKKVAGFLGVDAFWKLVTIPLGALDKYTTEAQRDQVVSTERTGTRDLKFEARK